MIRPAWIVVLGLLGGLAQAESQTQVHWIMGTYLRVTADGEDAAGALRACFEDVRRLDHVFSRFDPTSELSRLHRERSRRASADFAELLDRSLSLRERTGGAFDVTVGALTALWRAEDKPTSGAIAAARATCGGVSHEDGTVRLATGTRLDFDGIAKGYAVDTCVRRLRTVHVARAFVSFGESSLYVLGAEPTRTTWDVAVRGLDPDSTVGTLHLRDQAVSVSATRSSSGRRGTIVDPSTGRLLEDDRVAVVIAPSATDAEAYSKALLVWGDAGLARLERMAGVQAALVSARGVALGAVMRQARTFTALATPRPLGRVEDGLS